ncbi:hypothetical protein CB0940_02962 [Cercospora beticola]|uniref:F-box domain-containing protein n=1 Tax=Cercospora beticola TaxID=122368 RepID=A0A2G5I5A7_CERBT|nr:hypothetical protein CB0940_02962 [Cercospora beticola]PIA99984.1 hypothetical protein CB0940_02962 [Cercospora beticola]WPB00121.1 hypothetical protein RHO25_004740 [Cercospora beticola]CAK1361695.1 unnamed protein product [Cercospora beticola]
MILIDQQPPAPIIPVDHHNVASQSSSPLLSLPSELRNAIYELLLIHDIRYPLHQRRRPHDRFCANILRTCKQVHAEAAPILYGENTFLAHANLLTTLPAFLLFKLPNNKTTLPPVLYPSVTKLIKRFFFHVRLDIDSRYTKEQATECFTGLEYLEIEVFQPSYGTCDFTVLKLLEGVRGVGKAVVGGSVGDGNYARWLEVSMMSELGKELDEYTEEYVGGDKVSAVALYWDLDG